jgi:hypothetical protein
MTEKFTMCPNTAVSVNRVKTVVMFDVFEIGQFEIGQEVGRESWTMAVLSGEGRSKHR